MDNEKLELINNKRDQIKRVKKTIKDIEELREFHLGEHRGGGYYIQLSEYERNLFKTIVLTDRKMQLEKLEEEFAEM